VSPEKFRRKKSGLSERKVEFLDFEQEVTEETERTKIDVSRGPLLD
jgi:hypothetical protein